MAEFKYQYWELMDNIFHVGTFAAFSLQSFNELCARYDISPVEINENEDVYGRCYYMTPDGHNPIVCIVINLYRTSEKVFLPDFVSLVAHECLHATDYIFKAVAEDCPGDETRAYLLEHLVQQVLRAFELEMQRLSITPHWMLRYPAYARRRDSSRAHGSPSGSEQ